MIEQILTIFIVVLIYVSTWIGFTVYRRAVSGDKNPKISKYLQAVNWIYGIQAFLAVPMLLGDIARGQYSFNIIAVCIRQHHKFGSWGNTIFVFYTFLIFYSALFLIPMLITLVIAEMKKTDSMHSLDVILPIWFVLTLVIYFVPLVSALSETSSNTIGLIGILLWCLLSLFVIKLFRDLWRSKENYPSGTTVERTHDA